MKPFTFFLLFALLTGITSSCKMFNEIGENVGDGVGRGITPHVDVIGERAMESVRRGLDAAEFDVLIDSLVQRLSDSLGVGVAQMREMLIGDETATLVAGLRDTLVGGVTRAQLNDMVEDVMEDLLGENTRGELIRLRDELLGESLRVHLGGLRDELLGPATEDRLAALARAFVLEVSRSYADTMRTLIREDIEYAAGQTKGVSSWIKDNVISVIVVLGIVVFGLLAWGWYLWRQKQKVRKQNDEHRRMVEILTGEIDDLRKNFPEVYERMKDHIQKQAVRDKVEQPLRQILADQGILRSD